MARPEKNTAKKFSPGAEEIDDGWDTVAEELKEARGLDQFVYAPETIRPEVAQAARNVIADVRVSGEDCLRQADEVLDDFLHSEGLPTPHPKNFSIIGGPSPEQNKMMISAQDQAAYLFSAPGQNPGNHDAALVHYDDKNGKTTFVIAHGPQDDPSAASIANAVAIKAGFEVASGKHEPLYARGGKINDNLESVKDEFGLSHKPVDFAIAELTKPEFSPSYDLEVASKGLIHCYVINKDEGQVHTYKVERVHVDRDDLMKLYERIETPEAMKELVEKTETNAEVRKTFDRINVGFKTNPEVFPRFREKVFLTLVKQKLNDAGRKSLDEYVTERHLGGAMPDDIVDVVFDYLNNPAREIMKVEYGDVVVLATDELVQSMGRGKKTGYDIPFGSRLLLELQSGEELSNVCEGIIEDFQEKQSNEQLPDSSFTLLAYTVPNPSPSFPVEKEETVEDILGPVAPPFDLELEQDEAEMEVERIKDRRFK